MSSSSNDFPGFRRGFALKMDLSPSNAEPATSGGGTGAQSDENPSSHGGTGTQAGNLPSSTSSSTAAAAFHETLRQLCCNSSDATETPLSAQYYSIVSEAAERLYQDGQKKGRRWKEISASTDHTDYMRAIALEDGVDPDKSLDIDRKLLKACADRSAREKAEQGSTSKGGA
ncbi:hypothetical protein IAU60_006282 [Kwoniella sp. DSM 27419]